MGEWYWTSWVHIPSDHGKGIVAGEERASRDVGNGLFPSIDQIGVHLVGQWVGALSTEDSCTGIVSQTDIYSILNTVKPFEFVGANFHGLPVSCRFVVTYFLDSLLRIKKIS